MAFSQLKVTEITKISELSEGKSEDNIFTDLAKNGTTPEFFGGYFDMTARDDKYLIIVKNTNMSAAVTVTVKGGNGIQGSVDYVSDEIPAETYAGMVIESGRFKWVSDNDGYIDCIHRISHGVSGLREKGKVFITSEKDGVSVAIYKLPV